MKTLKAFLAGLSILFVLSVGASAQTSLASLDGAKVDIQGQKNKVVILAVGASWLPLSAKQADFANMLAKKICQQRCRRLFCRDRLIDCKIEELCDQSGCTKVRHDE